MSGFGDLEAVIMAHLWSHPQPTTVREVLTELQRHRDIAYTTVLAVMDNLYKKGWLRREPAGRAHRYPPGADPRTVRRSGDALALDDSNDRAEALMQFVGRMTLEKAAALRDALTSYERRLSGR